MLGCPPAIHARFDALCALVSTRGDGPSLRELGLLLRLAEALEDADDPDHIADLVGQLGLDVGAL